MVYGREKNKRTVGTSYEQTAGMYLRQKGLQILEYNYRCRFGEIDIIAKDNDYIVFCEVKYRNGCKSGHPLEAVDGRKQAVISKCAQYYLWTSGNLEMPCRFDVIGILDEEIFHIQNAFEYLT